MNESEIADGNESLGLTSNHCFAFKLSITHLDNYISN